MTPEAFQTLALAWLGVISTVAIAGISLYFSIKSKIDENKTRIDQHDSIANVNTKPTDPKV